MDSIKVFAPATVANVTCGFDVLGFAVEQPGDEIIIKKSAKPGIRITAISGDDGRLSLDPKQNAATVPIIKYLEKADLNLGFDISLHKKMPLGSGLGSSAASAVAGVFGINALLDENLNINDLLPFAMEGERLASGAAHADNVAPSLLGGFVLIRSYEPLDVIRIDTPDDLHATIIHPDIEINTKDARNILKKSVPIKSAIQQWGNVGGLIAGLTMGNYDLVSRSMEDVIIEPVRSMLIPGFDAVKSAALDTGALGCGISGSGPSIFALSTSAQQAEKIGQAMQIQFKSIDISSQVYISKINNNGPLIIS